MATMRPRPCLFALLAIALSIACAGKVRSTATAPLTEAQLAQFWMQPADITTRNLFWGAGGQERAPLPDVVYKVIGLDDSGYSGGYEVEDPNGRTWKVKYGDESQSEVAASRLLWAIGYHQPPVYFLRDWKKDGGRPEDDGRSARFRLETGYETEGTWSWHENDYVGTQPYKGLIVANLILNNWDLKSSQNRIFRVSDAHPGPSRWFVVQDLGAAFGRTKWPSGDRNNTESFEKQNLIKRVENGIVKFDYDARHTELFKDIAPADVVWTAKLFAQLTDEQWKDAFRAANYPEAVASRFIAKLKAKVQEGLTLEGQAGANP